MCLNLLLVNGKGKVQEVPELAPEGRSARFRALVTLTVIPVGLVKLLMAVVADVPLATTAQRDDEETRAYLAVRAAKIELHIVDVNSIRPPREIGLWP
jgi:hypothetical protein